MLWLRGLTILKRLEGIEPSIFVLAKLSYFTDLKKSEILLGNQIAICNLEST